MNLTDFWKLIEKTHQESGGVPEKQFGLLVQVLAQGTETDILQFERIFHTLMNRAYTTDVWNAAYIMNSCSDDGFSDFRAWLIAQGKTVYETALHDPDTLAEIVPGDRVDETEWESFDYAAMKAYEQQKGPDAMMPGEGFCPVLTGNLPLANPGPDSQQHYPKLWAKYGWQWGQEAESDVLSS